MGLTPSVRPRAGHRPLEPRSRLVAAALVSAALLLPACEDRCEDEGDDGGDEEGGGRCNESDPPDPPDPDPPQCNPGGAPGGAWQALVLNWLEVGPPGQPEDDASAPGECEDSIYPHHDHLSPVHGVHMPTPPNGELLLYHGESEERVWPIGSVDPAVIEWRPIPQCVTVHLPTGPEDDYPNIFCSGQTLLPNGNVLVAGGNVNNNPGAGGLYQAFSFDPRTATDQQPYGWTRLSDSNGAPEDMEVDRWYPTLTGLPDGRVLISGGASRVPNGQNSFEVLDPTAPPGQQIGKLPSSLDFNVVALANMPTYPFMFVLPNGDIFYAGGEGAEELAFDGRVLVPSYDGELGDWHWANYMAESSIAGGSAVMYRPGKVMKSGGNGGVANNVTEIIDLSSYPSDWYTNAPDEFLRRAEIPGAMHYPRHLHSLTVLPDGSVLATGGNMRGVGKDGDSSDNPCKSGITDIIDIPCEAGCPSVCVGTTCSAYGTIECEDSSECPNDAECIGVDAMGVGGYCELACTEENEPCPWIEYEPRACWEEAECPQSEDTEVCSTTPALRCDPGNPACFATRAAEIWDPDCETWEIYGPQQHERMYHSVALLLPDGRVISTGGGHEWSGIMVDQHNAEFFAPSYGTGEPLEVEIQDDDIPNDEDYTVHLPYSPGYVEVTLANDDGPAVEKVTLVRLGSATHAFDMGQRYLELPSFSHAAGSGIMTVAGPEPLNGSLTDSAVAPPGYYMMFLWRDGTPSIGQYVHLGSPSMSLIWAAPAGPGMQAIEHSCLVEPQDGACPSGAEESTVLDLPRADGPSGGVEGWNILVPAGLVQDDAAPSPAELAAVEARAVDACRAHWANEPSIEVNCDEPGVFETPVSLGLPSSPTLDLVLPDRQDGSGIFDGQSLATCQLGVDCCDEFDESMCSSAPTRRTPAELPLGSGEEYRVALDPARSMVEIATELGTSSSPLTGSVGYSFCANGDEGAPCPFYLGSFEAAASSRITTTLRCADGTTARQTIDHLALALAQPAFGIAARDSDEVGFPPGALVIDTGLDVGGTHHSRRRPNDQNVVIEAAGSGFGATALETTLIVPCNSSQAAMTVRYTLGDSDGETTIAAPPSVTIDVADEVRCGTPTTLRATARDPDDDVATVRWYVDDVLIAPSVSELTFTRAHTLRVVVRDQRGATTTSSKEIACH